MPTKRSQRAEVNTFVRGLITEASSLNFPPDASADEENFELNRDGARQRRLGMDFEVGGVFHGTGISKDQLDTAGIATYRWIEVAGSPDIEFLVVQFNRLIYFFDSTVETVSTTGYRGVVALGEFPLDVRFSFASLEGLLVVVSGSDSIGIIEFDVATGLFNVSYDRLRIRDLFGVQEINPAYENDDSYRGTLDEYHYYNLQNQSWGIPRRTADNVLYDPIIYYNDYLKKAPSNSEQVWPGLQFQPVGAGQVPFERIYPTLYEETLGASVNSAKGYFIIDALRRGQSRAEQVQANRAKYPELFQKGGEAFSNPTFKADFSPSGAACVAGFAGRVFYSGFEGQVIDGDERSPNYTNYVFFSQVVKNRQDFAKCYQEGDPTSRDSSDLVDTDGGFVRVSEAHNIIALIPFISSLIVIAKNGVWSLTGGSDYGFSASNNKVTKISTFGSINPASITMEGDQVFYWSEDGIYVLGRNQYGDFEVKSITLPTIQKLYEQIPSFSKETCVGFYDMISKKVRWLYNSSPIFDQETVTKELIFDTALGAFSQNRIYNLPTNNVGIGGIFRTSIFKTETRDDEVYSDSELVQSDIEPVIISDRVRTSGFSSTKYLGLKVNNDNSVLFSFSLYSNTLFLDWESVDNEGVDAKGFCLTGAQIAGDSGIDKQVPYLIMHFRRTEKEVDIDYNPTTPSGCLARGQWEFATGIQSNRWTPIMQMYRDRKLIMPSGPGGSIDNGFDVVTSKTKLRGKGKAFALYFETEPRKDCQILGWNVTINGDSIT